MAKTRDTLAESDIFNVVIGTAGHIDHGKSALVLRLTGVDPDRLKEEQERGMTVDLGFAPLVLEDGRRVGIIDVPGHERFVKNMVAGATGIDAVILVVAADDGVMPQTREHMDIMTLLGVPRGIVAITKIDLVEEELKELVIDDVRSYLEGTFLEGAPTICTSSVTGEGMDELRAAIYRLIETAEARSSDGIFRMPIQRVFSAKGHGTVVTGIPMSGKASVGDTLEIQPGGHRGRVRGVQAYKSAAESARAGHSSALNLSDIDYREVHRGMVVVAPDTFRAERLIEARLTCLPGLKRPIRHLSQVRFHSGTCEEIGRVAILEKGALAPGETSYVQIRLENPVVVSPGDRFVLRLHSPMITIGGGEIIGTSKWRLKTGKDYVLERLREREQALDSVDDRVASLAKDAGAKGAARDEVRRASLLEPAEFERRVSDLVAAGLLIELTRPARLLHADALAEVESGVERSLRSFHEKEPLRLRMDRGGLERELRADRQVLDLALQRLAADGRVRDDRERGVSLAEHEVRLDDRQRSLHDALDDLLIEKRFTTPRRDELPGILEGTAEEIEPLLRLLVDRGDVVELGDGVLFHRSSIDEAATLAVSMIDEEGELTVGRCKDLLSSTRKYIVPLLEHLDDLGVTRRDGNRRLKGPGRQSRGGTDP